MLQDLRGLAMDEQVDTSLWAARALIRATLDNGRTQPPGGDHWTDHAAGLTLTPGASVWGLA